ncbi:DUF5054 domain-containing protein [Lachnoclostridium sp.]|nr:DUF5054 domain-containing protein [Lachnoclostridium sp.]
MKKVIIVFKSHFDMGYTDLAENVLKNYCTGMLSDMLDTCEATREKPIGERYVWTMQAWLLTYMLSSPYTSDENKVRVEECIRGNQLVWTRTPFTVHTEFSGIEELARGFKYSDALTDSYGYRPKSAKMTDVPGHTTYLASLLNKQGVEFLHLGCNPCCTPPDVPRLFWWQGPDGGRVLTMYSKGQYGSSLLPPDDWEYPVWLSLAQTNDNKGTLSNEQVKELLDKARKEMPDTEIVIGTLDDFYNELSQCQLDEIPVVTKDLADTWIHGVGSYPKEVSEIRKTRHELCEAEKELALCKAYGLLTEEEITTYTLKIEEAYEQGLLFDEHTWGMAGLTSLGTNRKFLKKEFMEEINLPGPKLAEQSWDEQRVHTASMNRLTKELSTFSSQRLADYVLENEDEIMVFNGMSWTRSGITDLSFAANFLEGYDLFDGDTHEKISIWRDDEKLMSYVSNIPAMSWKKLKRKKQSVVSSEEKTLVEDNVLENKRFRIEVDKQNGSISSIYDKKNNYEYVEKNQPFGQYSYDVYGDQSEKRYINSYVYRFVAWVIDDLCRINMPEQADLTFTPSNFSMERCTEEGRSVLRWYSEINDISVSEFGNATSAEFILSLYDAQDVIDFSVKLHDKQATPFPEGGSISFPFAMDGCKIEIGKIGQVINPGKDVQKDANNALYCLENWMSITGNHVGMLVVPLDTPLFGIDSKGIYEFYSQRDSVTPHVYFNLFNTQWGTNFPQWIDGNLSYSFRFLPLTGLETTDEKQRLALEASAPILVASKNASFVGNQDPLSEQSSLIECETFRILSMQSKPGTDTVLVRLIDLEGKKGKADIRFNHAVKSVRLVSMCDDRCADERQTLFEGIYTLETMPFEIHTLELSLVK